MHHPAPAEPASSSYRTREENSPRTVGELSAALPAAAPCDRELSDDEMRGLELGETRNFGVLGRAWRHRLVMRTDPEIRAAIASATDPGIPRTAARQAPEEVAPDIPFWPVAYGAVARDGLAAATQQEREAVTAFEEELNELPQACGDLCPDTVGDLYVGRLPGPGHSAWTSVLGHVDNEAQQVLVLAIVSGP